MTIFTKAPILILLLFFAAILIVMGMMMIIPSFYTNYGVIEEFPDSNQKFVDDGTYQVTNRKLNNAERDDVIIPYDEIRYQFDIHNLKDYPADIYYELEFFKGNDKEGTYNGTDQIIPKSTSRQIINKIFLKTPGSYDIKLNIFFKNFTDNKYAQFSPGIEGIEVLSKSDQIQLQQNDSLMLGVFVSAAIGFGTATALAFSVHYSREVVNETKRSNRIELSKNKPRFLVEHASYKIQQNMLQLNADLVNDGNTSAENLRYSFVAKNHPFGEEFISERLEKKENKLFDHYIGSLSSGHSSSIEPFVEFPLKTEFVCIALWLKYDFVDEKEHEEIHFLLFQKGMSNHSQFTIQDNKIKEIRNRIKENKK